MLGLRRPTSREERHQLGNLQHDFTETINAYSNGYQTHIHVHNPVISITGTGKVSKAKQTMDS
jgi:hypothetical protein